MPVRCAVASTTIDGLHGSRVGPSIDADEAALPGGIVHAYNPGAEASLCGVELDDLYIWPDYDFAVLAHPQRCARCGQLAD